MYTLLSLLRHSDNALANMKRLSQLVFNNVYAISIAGRVEIRRVLLKYFVEAYVSIGSIDSAFDLLEGKLADKAFVRDPRFNIN